MPTNPEPMIEDNTRPEKPLARARETSATISAEGPAAPDNTNAAEAPATAAQPTTPGSPARSRPRHDTAVEEPDPAAVAAQAALPEIKNDTNPPELKPKAATALDITLENREDIMTDVPTALPGEELRVRPLHPQRTNN